MSANRNARGVMIALAVLGSVGAIVGLSIAADPPPAAPNPPPAAIKTTPLTDGRTLSGPYTHDNLTVFLVHGPDRLAGR